MPERSPASPKSFDCQMTLETFLKRGQKDAGSPEQQQLQTFPPMMGLLLLLARPLRPWLIGVFSILIFLVTGTAVAMLFGLHRLDLSGMKTAWVVAGIMFLVIAVVGVATRLVALACGSSSFAVGDGVVDFLAVTELRSWTISSPTAVDSFARQCAPSLRRPAAI